MKKIKEERIITRWDSKNYGLCEATIWDGQLTDFRFSITGSADTGICTNDVGYLRELHKVLGELLDFLNKKR